RFPARLLVLQFADDLGFADGHADKPPCSLSPVESIINCREHITSSAGLPIRASLSQAVARGPVVSLVEQFQVTRQLAGFVALAQAAQFFEAQQQGMLLAQAADDALIMAGGVLAGVLCHGCTSSL